MRRSCHAMRRRNSANVVAYSASGITRKTFAGEVAEWSNAAVLKTVRLARVSGVRIPPSPPIPAMYYVYVLRSRNQGRHYIGSSANPDKRLIAHNAGRVRSTKKWRPWERVFLEEHPNRVAAEKRERYLKSGWGRRWLRKCLLGADALILPREVRWFGAKVVEYSTGRNHAKNR
jgi:putative endonuclease